MLHLLLTKSSWAWAVFLYVLLKQDFKDHRCVCLQSLHPPLFFFFFLNFETGSLYVVQVSLELLESSHLLVSAS